MSEPTCRHRVTIPYDDDTELVRKLTVVLGRLGYHVAPAVVEPVTVKQLAALVGRPVNSVSRSLRSPACPPFEATRGRGALRRRILTIRPTERLLAFLKP